METPPPLLEVCLESPEAAELAEAAGADRIELCSGLCVGGLTPSDGLISETLRRTSLPLHILIRPRSGGFVYSPREVEVMKRDVERALELGVQGVVVGALNRAGSLDSEVLHSLLDRVGQESSTTLHRAFDFARDWRDALDEAVALGFDRVLSSGQAPSAGEGIDTLAAMVRRAGDRIQVMAGGGVRPGCAAENVRSTQVAELHFSASRRVTTPSASRALLSSAAPLAVNEHRELDAALVTELVRCFSASPGPPSS